MIRKKKSVSLTNKPKEHSSWQTTTEISLKLEGKCFRSTAECFHHQRTCFFQACHSKATDHHQVVDPG